MRRFLCCLVSVLVLMSATAAYAQMETGSGSNRQVGIGLLGGAAFPFANEHKYKITESWGFYVDIPIISTFHISPSTILYRLDPADPDTTDIGNSGITDLSLNFKFVIPLRLWRIYLAALMGASHGRFVEGGFIHLHVGGNVGFAYRIVSNLDFTTMCQYKLIIDGDQRNVNMIQAMAGLQFNF